MDTLIEQVRHALSARQKQVVSGDGLKPAGVLLLLYPQGGEHHVLLTKRTSHVDDHKGEISFPGGAFHPGVDANLQHTALRESAEEVGVITDHVEVLGELDDTPTRSNYLIFPFVGVLRQPQVFVPRPVEVAEILEVPLRVLQDPRTLHSEPREYAGRLVTDAYYLYQDHVIYGATARILQQFLGLLPPSSS